MARLKWGRKLWFPNSPPIWETMEETEDLNRQGQDFMGPKSKVIVQVSVMGAFVAWVFSLLR